MAFVSFPNAVDKKAQKKTTTTELTTEQKNSQSKFASTSKSTIDELLGIQADVVKDTSGADAAKKTSEGYGKEADAYEAAAKTSDENAYLAKLSGDITEYQDYRKYQTTAGAAVATNAGNGFKNAGSALYLAKSSFQQANLTQQIDRINGVEKEIGYLETAASNRAQGAAATAAKDAADALGKVDTDAASTATTEATDLSKSLTSYFDTVDPTSITPESKLSLSLLKDNPDTELSTAANKLTDTATTDKTTWDTAASSSSSSLTNYGWGVHTNA